MLETETETKAELFSRLCARFTKLPKICSSRGCRRHNRCMGRSIHCVEDHKALFNHRWGKICRGGRGDGEIKSNNKKRRST